MRKMFIIALCLMLSAALFGCSDTDANPNAESTVEPEVQISDGAETDSDADADTDMDIDTSADIGTDTGADTGSDTGTWEWGIFPFNFTAQDLNGNLVTEESMGEKQLFFVHLWATWCPPCVVEMPDLADVVREYSDRVGFLGLLDDFSSNPEGAINIIEASDMPDSFINVDARNPELSGLLSMVQTGYVPTTVIFISNGEMFEPLIGAYGAGYGAILEAILAA